MIKVRSSSLKTCSLASLNGVRRRTILPYYTLPRSSAKKRCKNSASKGLMLKRTAASSISFLRQAASHFSGRCSLIHWTARRCNSLWGTIVGMCFSLFGWVGKVCRNAFRTRPKVGLQLETA